MPQVVTADLKQARRIVFIDTRNKPTYKQLAARAHRRINKTRLNYQGEDFEPDMKPRCTGWDLT